MFVPMAGRFAAAQAVPVHQRIRLVSFFGDRSRDCSSGWRSVAPFLSRVRATRWPPKDAWFCTRARRRQNRTGAPAPLRTAFGLFDRAACSRVRTNRIEAAISVA